MYAPFPATGSISASVVADKKYRATARDYRAGFGMR
jgi:hypothetical protein